MIPRNPGEAPDLVLYTDADTSASRISSLLFKGAHLPPTILLLSVSRFPESWARWPHSGNLISGIEMVESLAWLWVNRRKLARETTNLYIDNNKALTYIGRGDSSSDIIDAMVDCCCGLAESFSIDIRPGVATRRNPHPPTAPLTFLLGNLTFLLKPLRGRSL